MKERTLRKAAINAAFLFISCLLATAANASVNISPLRVDLSDNHDKDVIEFTNGGDTTKSYEVEVVAWTQTDERREVYAPTEDVLAVPPLFTVAPGERQVIRVGSLVAADANVERAYRMFITEIESPQTGDGAGASVAMRLQIGIPVFVAPNALPHANLAFVESQKIGDQFYVRFRNTGNTHVKVIEIQYLAPGSDTPAVTPATTYFLAGMSGLLPIDMPGDGDAGKVTIVTETLGAIEYELPFTP